MCCVQDPPISRSLVVLLVCVVCLLCYAVAAAVLRKLDQLDLRRASVVPLCGKDGLCKYEIQVKTGWMRGAGEGAGLKGPGHTATCVGSSCAVLMDLLSVL